MASEWAEKSIAQLHAQFAQSAKLEQAIKADVIGLDYGR